MNTYLLDTDILSHFQTGHLVVLQNVAAHAHRDMTAHRIAGGFPRSRLQSAADATI